MGQGQNTKDRGKNQVLSEKGRYKIEGYLKIRMNTAGIAKE